MCGKCRLRSSWEMGGAVGVVGPAPWGWMKGAWRELGGGASSRRGTEPSRMGLVSVRELDSQYTFS